MAGATDLERLVVQLSADVRGYQKSLDRAVAATNQSAGKIERRFNNMNRNISSKFKTLGAGGIGGIGGLGSIKSTLAGLGLALGARQIQQYADSWTEARNKIAAAGQVAGRSGRSLEEINDIAQRSRTGFSETVSLYSRLLQTTANVAKSEEEVARATEIVSKSFAAGGANAQEAAASVLQLGQALGSGVLQGDELRSIRENAPLLARAIAKEFGVAIGELKKLGAQGELTTDRVFKAILGGGEEIEAAFDKTSPTIANGFTAVDNAFTELVGTFDKGTGTSKNLSAELFGLAKIIEKISDNTGEAIKQWDEFMNSGSELAKVLHDLNEPGANFSRKLKQGRNPFDQQFFFGGPDEGDPANHREFLEARIKALEEEKDKLVPLIDEQRKNGLIIGGNITQLEVLNEKLAELRQQLSLIPVVIGKITGAAALTSLASGPGAGLSSGAIPSAAAPGAGNAALVLKASDNLLKVISKLESGNNANIINNTNSIGGQALRNFNLVTMSIREVLALQARVIKEGPKGTSSAAGMFQITKATLEDFAKKLNISLDEKFSPETQKKIAEGIIAEAAKQPDPVKALKGRFESLQGLPDAQVLQLLNQSVESIARGNEELEKRATIIADTIAKGRENVDMEKLKADVMKLGTGEAEKQVKLQELKNDLLQQGIKFEDLTADEQKQLSDIADTAGAAAQQVEDFQKAQDAAAESAKKLADAQEEANKTMQEIGQAFGSAFQGFISDLVQGKKLTDALRDALINLGESLLNIAIQNLTSSLGGAGGGLLGGLFGGGGGGLLSGLFHSGGEIGKSGGVTLARAGDFSGAKRYHSGRLPGLRNDEMAGIFKKGELVIPSWEHLANLMRNFSHRSSVGGGVVQHNTFIAPDWKTSLRTQNQLARTAGSELARVNRIL